MTKSEVIRLRNYKISLIGFLADGKKEFVIVDTIQRGSEATRKKNLDRYHREESYMTTEEKKGIQLELASIERMILRYEINYLQNKLGGVSALDY